MQRLSDQALSEVQEALRLYIAEVEKAKLQPSTIQSYLLNAKNFVRWLEGDFEPGGKTKYR